MTDKKTEALKLAQEALNELIPNVHDWYGAKVHRANAAITAIREALAEQQGGKTGWPAGMLQDDDKRLSKWLASKPDARQKVREALEQQKELQRLRALVRAQQITIEKLEAQQQEPVTGVVIREGLPTLLQDRHIKSTDQRLYTFPPASKPLVGLTDEDVAVVLTGDASLATRLDELTPSWIALVKAVEAKLREKNQ